MNCPDCKRPIDRREYSKGIRRCPKCRAKRNGNHLPRPDAIPDIESEDNNRLIAERLAEVRQRRESGNPIERKRA